MANNLGPTGLNLDGTQYNSLYGLNPKGLFRKCLSFNDFKANWKYSGTTAGLPPSTLAGDTKLNEFSYNDSGWGNIDISTDYVPDVNQSYWHVRKLFYFDGSFNISATVDDNWAWTLIPADGSATVVLGDVADLSGNISTAVPSATISNYTINVPKPGIYIFAGRGYEGGGSDNMFISSVDSNLSNIWIPRF